MHAFAYHRPATLAEAQALLTTDPDARALAGGQTLLPTLKQRLARFSTLVDLSRLPELAGVREENGALVIGAAVRHAEVAASPLVRAAIPALAELAGSIGDRQVRNLGTLGGAIANADPAADYPAALVALDATVATTARTIPAEAFFTGMFETALEPGELVVSVAFPRPTRAGYAKIRNPASRYAIVGAFVAETGGAIRVAVTGAATSVFRAPAFEAALLNNFTQESLTGLAIDPTGLNEDLHASAEYRAHLVGVAAKRAVERA